VIQRLSERRKVVVMLGGVALLVALVYGLQWWGDSRGEGSVATLEVGDNEVELGAGRYELWWQTESRPPEVPSISDFDFSVEGRDGSSGAVTAPNASAGYPGPEPRTSIWLVGGLTITEPGDFRVNVEIVGEVPPGVVIVVPD
jgi:hypothetical protein